MKIEKQEVEMTDIEKTHPALDMKIILFRFIFTMVLMDRFFSCLLVR